ncbi:hypothetical protein BRADI_1g59163v3 [Brachypodium distachyon]|uniref:Uncharacterized protein n=1 Tax=Brachypodium distachyon TaxID=15368 RepID=A0A0Q3S7Y2_BRADI|nr:hypothetical protein BRADI_1g59163v3 [Brachypodium distachyon]
MEDMTSSFLQLSTGGKSRLRRPESICATHLACASNDRGTRTVLGMPTKDSDGATDADGGNTPSNSTGVPTPSSSSVEVEEGERVGVAGAVEHGVDEDAGPVGEDGAAVGGLKPLEPRMEMQVVVLGLELGHGRRHGSVEAGGGDVHRHGAAAEEVERDVLAAVPAADHDHRLAAVRLRRPVPVAVPLPAPEKTPLLHAFNARKPRLREVSRGHHDSIKHLVIHGAAAVNGGDNPLALRRCRRRRRGSGDAGDRGVELDGVGEPELGHEVFNEAVDLAVAREAARVAAVDGPELEVGEAHDLPRADEPERRVDAAVHWRPVIGVGGGGARVVEPLAADVVALLQHRHGVALPPQLARRRQPRQPAAHHAHLLRLRRRRLAGAGDHDERL